MTFPLFFIQVNPFDIECNTLKEHNYKAPTKETGTPYKWVHGEELWTWLGSHPDRTMNMVAGMRSHNAGNVSGDAYPWSTELGKLEIEMIVLRLCISLLDRAISWGRFGNAIRS